MARTSAPLALTTSHRTLGTTDFPRAQLYTYYTLLVHYRHRAAKFNAATAERYIPPYILYNNPLTSWGIQQVAARGSRCTVKSSSLRIHMYRGRRSCWFSGRPGGSFACSIYFNFKSTRARFDSINARAIPTLYKRFRGRFLRRFRLVCMCGSGLIATRSG